MGKKKKRKRRKREELEFKIYPLDQHWSGIKFIVSLFQYKHNLLLHKDHEKMGERRTFGEWSCHVSRGTTGWYGPSKGKDVQPSKSPTFLILLFLGYQMNRYFLMMMA